MRVNRRWLLLAVFGVFAITMKMSFGAEVAPVGQEDRVHNLPADDHAVGKRGLHGESDDKGKQADEDKPDKPADELVEEQANGHPAGKKTDTSDDGGQNSKEASPEIKADNEDSDTGNAPDNQPGATGQEGQGGDNQGSEGRKSGETNQGGGGGNDKGRKSGETGQGGGGGIDPDKKSAITEPTPGPDSAEKVTTPEPTLDPEKIEEIMKELNNADQGVHLDAKTGGVYWTVFDGKKCCSAESEDEKKKYEKDGCPTEKIIKEDINDDGESVPKCMADFDKGSVKKSSGTGFYEAFAYCQKVFFFGKGGVKKLRESKLMDKTMPKTLEDHRKNWMQDRVLALVEGTLTCQFKKAKNSADKKVRVAFFVNYPKGAMGAICPETKKMLGKDWLNLPPEQPAFITGGFLSDRLCPSRPSKESKVELQDLSYEYNVEMVVQHNCEGNLVNHTVKFAKPIEVGELRDHVFEFRQLVIELDGRNGPSEEIVDWDWKKPEKCVGYRYYVPLAKEMKPDDIDTNNPDGGGSGVIDGPDEKPKVPKEPKTDRSEDSDEGKPERNVDTALDWPDDKPPMPAAPKTDSEAVKEAEDEEIAEEEAQILDEAAGANDSQDANQQENNPDANQEDGPEKANAEDDADSTLKKDENSETKRENLSKLWKMLKL